MAGFTGQGNAEWQRRLSLSWQRIGDLRQTQGNLTAAVDAHTAGLEISQQLVSRDADNLDWQRDHVQGWRKSAKYVKNKAISIAPPSPLNIVWKSPHTLRTRIRTMLIGTANWPSIGKWPGTCSDCRRTSRGRWMVSRTPWKLRDEWQAKIRRILVGKAI